MQLELTGHFFQIIEAAHHVEVSLLGQGFLPELLLEVPHRVTSDARVALPLLEHSLDLWNDFPLLFSRELERPLHGCDHQYLKGLPHVRHFLGIVRRTRSLRRSSESGSGSC